jgi:sec-independent protein translocase protein TatA
MIGDLFSPMHLLVILVIALIVFGPGKLPELGSSLGKAIKEFKKIMNDPEKPVTNDIVKSATNDPEKTVTNDPEKIIKN